MWPEIEDTLVSRNLRRSVLHACEPGQPRVTVAPPTFPGTIRGVNLDLSRYRIDSSHLLGMTLLRDTLKTAVKQLDVKGGPTWAAERLIGRVRYLATTMALMRS
jgi:hypothetical protein